MSESKSNAESLVEVVLILGAHLDLKKSTNKSHKKREPLTRPHTRKCLQIPDSDEEISDFLLFSSKKTCNFPSPLKFEKKREN
jgi:hypothetical protein